MLIFLFLLPLAAHMGNAQADPNHLPRLRARQNTANSTASRPTSTRTSASPTRAGSCTSQGWASCGSVCIDVAKGATCCDTRASYWCMPGTSCLFNGICCPNKVDRGACASISSLQLLGNIGSSTSVALKKTSPSSVKNTKVPTSFPTVDEDMVAPKKAAPSTTTYGPITATVGDNPVTLAFSGEVLPLQTVANHKPVPGRFKDAVLAALAGDPDTNAFGDLLAQAPSVFEGLEEGKEYYLFAPTTRFVVDFLMGLQDHPPGLVPRKVFADPNLSHQFAEKPKDGPDIKRVSTTLKTALVGKTKYADLGEGESARVVSNPTGSGDGSVEIVSGLGHSTLVHPDEILFEGGVIMKCDGFFTLPRAIETVFAGTSGRLWSTALQKADMLKEISGKSKVTIFAVQDSALDENEDLPGSDLSRYIHDGLSYTPGMSDQPCLPTRDGGSIRITTEGDDRFVNGIRISTSNVLAKNGVIHYLEGKIPRADKCPDPQKDPTDDSASSAVPLSMLTVLGLSAASLAMYLGV
ncbi:unnamed protein product [Tuber aestivum]|uniref:FAS1 domain-containing protein n=1 Tax=Tuber aestivum TaxID=59557 RepID=A0A292PWD9_9PEZI|nr:unnamed protein product [Tuber aestivum]